MEGQLINRLPGLINRVNWETTLNHNRKCLNSMVCFTDKTIAVKTILFHFAWL